VSLQFLYKPSVRISTADGNARGVLEILGEYFSQYPSLDVRGRVNTAALDFLVMWGQSFGVGEDDEASEVLMPPLRCVAESHRCCWDGRRGGGHWILRDWVLRRAAPSFLRLSPESTPAADALLALPLTSKAKAARSVREALSLIPAGLLSSPPTATQRVPVLRSGLYAATRTSGRDDVLALPAACAIVAATAPADVVEAVVKQTQKSAHTMLVRLCSATECDANANMVLFSGL